MASCGRLSLWAPLAEAFFAATIAVAPSAAHGEEPLAGAPRIGVVGTTFQVQMPNGSVRAGAALVGAILGVAVGGRSLRVRIAGAEKDIRDPNNEVLLYDFRVITPSGGEEPLCSPDPDGRQLGFPLAGRSDPAGILTAGEPDQFELVCTAGPQGKCLRFGYAPWRKAPDGRPLTDWYNACVRMLRGDYCGDGRHFTRDGTWIDIYDRIGIQSSDRDPSLSFEAAWGPNGAICVARTRLPDLIDLDGLARSCPRLASHLGPSACSDTERDALVMNRSR